MSIALETAVRELKTRVQNLDDALVEAEKRIAALEAQNPRHAIFAEPDPVEAYKERFGEPPHHRMKIETIKEKLGWTTTNSAP